MLWATRGRQTHTHTQIYTQAHSRSNDESDGSVVVMASLTESYPWGFALINKDILCILNSAADLWQHILRNISARHLRAFQWHHIHQKKFILINIRHTENTQIFSATATHRTHTKQTKKHAFRWSLWHCSSQHSRRTFASETPLCNVFLSTAEGWRGFTTTRIMTHLHLPTKCWLCKA